MKGNFSVSWIKLWLFSLVFVLANLEKISSLVFSFLGTCQIVGKSSYLLTPLPSPNTSKAKHPWLGMSRLPETSDLGLQIMSRVALMS